MFKARRVKRRRAIARAAVVAGRRADQERPTAPEGTPSSTPDPAQVGQVTELREQGILTEEEFTAEKKKLLGI
jgi:hypothetical protein